MSEQIATTSKLEVQVTDMKPMGGKDLVAVATIAFNGAVASTGWKLYRNGAGYTVKGPQYKNSSGVYKDSTKFLRTYAQEDITKKVIQAAIERSIIKSAEAVNLAG